MGPTLDNFDRTFATRQIALIDGPHEYGEMTSWMQQTGVRFDPFYV